MPIIYALVAKGPMILAEYTPNTGNFAQVTKKILEKIKPEEGRMTFLYDQHSFHIIVKEGLTFLCMADEAFGRRVPFTFLEAVMGHFFTMYADRGRQATVAYSLNAEFARTLEAQMRHFNDPQSDRLQRMRSDIDEVRGQMVENIGMRPPLRFVRVLTRLKSAFSSAASASSFW
jgi:vesicle-associated membrane protein 7